MRATLKPPRGRPRRFDPERALAEGRRLFHAQGFEGFTLATLTERLNVNPPSFYAIFESKLAFYEQVLARYAKATLSLDDMLRPGRDPAEALAELLEQAARTYAADPEARGCLVLEGVRGDHGAPHVLAARSIAERRRRVIREFVAATHPKAAAAVTDVVASMMSGLSASAREGMDSARLVAVARAAAAGLGPLLD